MRTLVEIEDGVHTELGWYCEGCLVFNGVCKENLTLCRACETPRPTATREEPCSCPACA